MKNLFKTFARAVKGVWLVAGIAAVCATPALAQSGLQTRYGKFTGYLCVTNAQAPTIGVATKAAVWRDRGMAFYATIVSTNAATANVTFRFDVSYDGTNFTTGSPLVWNVPLNGTTAVVAYTNILKDVLDNSRYIELTSISNAHSAPIYVTNCYWSIFP